MKYKFVGNGMGVPGLPHQISDEEADAAAGLRALLNEAIKNGNYVEVDKDPHPVPLPKKERGLNKEQNDG